MEFVNWQRSNLRSMQTLLKPGLKIICLEMSAIGEGIVVRWV